MKHSWWLTIVAAAVLIFSCFLPWMRLEHPPIYVSGFASSTKQFGKPGLVFCILSFLIICFIVIQKNWSIRTAFFISMLNIIWALRNYFIIGSCRGGICPEKLVGIYLMLISSFLLSGAMIYSMSKMKLTRTS